MTQEPYFAERFRISVCCAGGMAALGVVGLVLSVLGAPTTITWAAAAGAAVAGGWGGKQLVHRYSERR
ncbi:hypothetical protein [Streptomyces sp. NBC_01198]|uniref:hypothetical protein n=1 Tax=Streptomyces sp. NBC_01198 TaxID=2903769 RepID=UPI002E102409|nr:hypothetical protein OG702_34930 [Streptomyces sp. NBC_01198]